MAGKMKKTNFVYGAKRVYVDNSGKHYIKVYSTYASIEEWYNENNAVYKPWKK